MAASTRDRWPHHVRLSDLEPKLACKVCGKRMTFKSVAHTYCAENVGLQDVSALNNLRRSTRDWRAESGADFLIRLVQNKDGAGGEDITSIFNPANPSFILKDGCSP